MRRVGAFWRGVPDGDGSRVPSPVGHAPIDVSWTLNRSSGRVVETSRCRVSKSDYGARAADLAASGCFSGLHSEKGSPSHWSALRPVHFSLTLNRGCGQILDLQPSVGATLAIGAAEPLGHDPFTAKRASVAKDDRAVAVVSLIACDAMVTLP
jgi:hypothetical protein